MSLWINDVLIFFTHFIPTTTVVVVTLSIPTTTVVVVAHCIPTTTFVVVDNDLSNLSAVNRPRARNPRDTCAVNRMYYHCSCTAAIEQVLCSWGQPSIYFPIGDHVNVY